ncbi:MAG: SRPBCC domain-containing protein [Acidimicrobiia bacterium]|nr:SRPBCC domain-containing protein [Acidimicrobiia bacterium]
MEYTAEATIEAPADLVWSILADAGGYVTWDSGVEKMEGEISPGGKIKLFSKVNPGRAFPVKVAIVEPERVMTWTGGMPLGLFKGVRTFTLVGTTPNQTTFTMREVFSGPMLGMVAKKMPDLQPAFDQFAAGLKAEAEARAGR